MTPRRSLGMLALLTLLPATAHAFAEDVCYPRQSGNAVGAPTTCNPLPASCSPAGSTSAACRSAALATFGASTAASATGRSTVHTDATHLLAQAVGFGATDAYWIAAYDEAVDLGTFEPRDFTGARVGNGALATANIDGFVRTNGDVGGQLYHFSAPRVAGTDGLHPAAQDSHVEPVLAHLRRWAMQGVGTSVVECTGGLTTAGPAADYATGAQCYPSGTVATAMATLGAGALSMATVPTGPQVVVRDATPSNATTDPIYAPGFDAVVGGSNARARDARLGVYLHTLADRVSHHVCVDRSLLTGPYASGDTFRFDFTDGECVQDLHALRHLWETGVDFSQLPTAHRTTEAALSAVYDELVAFAQARGVLRAGAADPAFKGAVLQSVAAALAEVDAVQRMTRVAQAACARGYAPFPGTVTCGT